MATMLRAVLLGLVLLVGCSVPGAHSSTLPTDAPPTETLPTALAPLRWALGDWDDGKTSEHWVAAGGAIYGISFDGASFKVMIIDDGDGDNPPDNVVRFYAMPAGSRSVEYRLRASEETSATFATDAKEFPQTIVYHRLPDGGLGSTVSGEGRTFAFSWNRGAAKPAPDLEAADLAFADATAQRGVDGWLDAFDPQGGMLTKDGRIERAAIADAMRPVLTTGRLVWRPIASGQSGALGYTVGKATFTGATAADGWRRSYVKIWHRQPDGVWKVLFDTGRTIQD